MNEICTTVILRTVTQPARSGVQLSCSCNFIAISKDIPTSISLWDVNEIHRNPVLLIGHRKAITALTFSLPGCRPMLCSASSDCIIIWILEHIKAAVATRQDPRGTVLCQSQGHVKHLSFSRDGTSIAACVGQSVFIIDSQNQKNPEVLDVGNDVLLAEFLASCSLLVTANENRTFKVWNLETFALQYQSNIISASPIVTLYSIPSNETFVCGTYDGTIRTYSYTDSSKCRLVHQIDIAKSIKSFRSMQARLEKLSNGGDKRSRGTWQQDYGAVAGARGDGEAEISAAILSVNCLSIGRSQLMPSMERSQRLRTELYDQPVLSIGCTSGILFVGAKTLDVLSWIDFSEPIKCKDTRSQYQTISMAGNVLLALTETENQLISVVEGLLSNEVHILGINILKLEALANLSLDAESERQSDSRENGATELLSVLASTPLCENSPLKAEMNWKRKDSSGKGTTSLIVSHKPGSLNKSGKIVDHQPLTFHNKIKSSGYTAANINARKTSSSQLKDAKSKQKVPSSAGSKTLLKEYPIDSQPPTELSSKWDVAERTTPVNKIRFAGNGKFLACALGNNSVQVFNMPYQNKGSALVGHTGIVNNVNWSHNSKWLITSSDDFTASVWAVGATKPTLTFSSINHNFDVDKETASSQNNLAFSKPVCWSQFYYLDKFVLLTSGNELFLYKYQLDETSTDIKRYQTNSRYKLVQSLTLQNAQQITAMSAVNSFHSYIVLCAGSDKSIEVFDMNVGQSAMCIPNVHSRVAHVIKQNEGSAFVTHPSFAYDLFATAAAGDCIKLWDLKSQRCIQRYEGHANRAYHCGIALSPCGRFLCTGSEDRSLYVFDIRMSTYLHKIAGHSETVSDVTYNPLHPELISGTLDGKLYTYHEAR